MNAIRRRSQTGFTLIELIAVMVLLGILVVNSSRIVSSIVGIYQDATRRDEITQQGRFAVERLSRELRHALPGSVRVNNSGSPQCIEFIPIVSGSSYLGLVSDTPINSFQAVDFNFTSAAGYQVAVYTVDNTDVYGVATTALTDLDSVGIASGGTRQVNFTAPHQFAAESPPQRFYIIRNRVSFCASADSLMRYEGYPATVSQPVPPASGGVLLAEHIQINDGGAFEALDYTAGTLQRAAVVHLDLRFRDNASSNEWARFSQEVFLRNTP